MHGIALCSGPSDWEILQQKNGSAEVTLKGSYNVHPAALKVGVESVRPMYRIMREDDNSCVCPWTEMAHTTRSDFTGTFQHTFSVEAGGPYRIETTLETKSTVPNLTWLYRGDCVLHFGVGNVFLIAGQSNAAGYSRDYAPDPPSMDVHLYRNRGRWDLACHPMNESTGAGSPANEEMGVPGVSPYLSFGKLFARTSGCPVGLVQAALGGSPISRWSPKDGDLYRNMLQKIRETHGQYAGILWYQGCADCNPKDAPLYYSRFAEMVTALRKELNCQIPFFTFQLNRMVGAAEDDCWGMVREAQRKAALEIPGVFVLPTTNCPLSDSIHNSAAANLLLGEKLAKQCAHVLLGQPDFEAPDLKLAELTDPKTLRLTFSHMALGWIIPSCKGSDTGFTLEDEESEIGIDSIRYARQNKNSMDLKLNRKPGKRPVLSFGWQANPVPFPPVDEVTFLPPLSFYRIPVVEKGDLS